MKSKSFIGVVVALVAMLVPGAVKAQDPIPNWTQDKYCPGWNNPISFTSGNVNSSTAVPGVGYYSGQGGGVDDTRPPDITTGPNTKPCPNPMTGETGARWHTLYTAAQLATVTSGGCSSSLPNNGNQFLIINDLNGTDPNTGNHLKYVPNHFNTQDSGEINTNLTRSIRVGDGCKNGSTWSSDNGAAALYYTMRPTSGNAMLYLYYAIVAESPTHGMIGNPTFIIRVMRKNASNQWEQISDTLAYYITSARTSTASETCPNLVHATLATGNQAGWHLQGSVLYKDWAKVCINLSQYLYEDIQIQTMIYDCFYNAHYAYAYIAGECRQMALGVQGCPAGSSSDVTTLSAPRGMMNYEWRACKFGVSDPIIDLNPGGANSHYSFRTLTSGTEAQGMHRYHVQADDFQVNYRTRTPGGHDSIMVRDSVGNRQTFECRMTSALDPAKPFQSSLYANVQNIKPTMSVDSLSFCDTTVLLHNLSYVPGDPGRVADSVTQWSFYNNPAGPASGVAPVAEFVGDSVHYQFTTPGVKSVRVRTFIFDNNHGIDSTCWSEKTYRIKMLTTPKAGMTVSPHVLCDADSTTLVDTTSSTVRRQWTFLKPTSSNYNDTVNLPEYDTLTGYYGDYRSITRPFSHNIEPIALTVRNGQYYLNPENRLDTHWCENRTYDTVAVFVHPELEVTGDTIVCMGSQTDATVRAVGVDNCTYQWSLTNGTITGGIPAGNHLAVSPYADTSIYYVKVTTEQGCVAWDSVHAYLVVPQLAMMPEDGRMCPGDTVMLMGSAADHYTWTASPADASLVGQDSAAVINVSPLQTTTYTMVGHGTNDCDASPLTKTVTVVPLPVPRMTVTPGFVDSDDPTVTLRDVSPNGVRSEWLFYGNDFANTREVVHTFGEAEGRDSVHVLLTSYNVMDCPSEKTFAIPVMLFTAWFPNAFQPESDDNEENMKFKLYSVNDYEMFHIYIYNRGGQLVFESDDPHFEWDGKRNGEPCPQGAYVYVCNYRKPGTPTLITKNGTVTLIR